MWVDEWSVREAYFRPAAGHIGQFAADAENPRNTAALENGVEPLIGVLDREALLSMLFRETDRVQRMHTSLCLMVVEIQDLARTDAGRDDLVVEFMGRVQRLLRSYDVYGRIGPGRFVLGLPGCTPANAASLADRISSELSSVFSGGRLATPAARFGIAPSHGRSPLVVLREAERALGGGVAIQG